jgi:hypothetical protein
LKFTYTGNGCDGADFCEDFDGGPSGIEQVYLNIIDCETTAFFQGTVDPGNTIVINSRGKFLCPDFTVSVQLVDFDEEREENTGAEIQFMNLPTTCPFWTLNANYGSLQLEAFTTSLDGTQAVSAEVFLNFALDNVGAFNTVLQSGQIESTFGSGPVPGVPLDVDKRTRVTLETQNATVELLGQGGTVLSFSQQLSAISDTQFQLPCDDFANLTVTL